MGVGALGFDPREIQQRWSKDIDDRYTERYGSLIEKDKRRYQKLAGKLGTKEIEDELADGITMLREKKDRKTIILWFLQYLEWFRDKHIDDLPPYDVVCLGSKIESIFKCCASFIYGLNGALQSIISTLEIAPDSEFCKLAEKYQKHPFPSKQQEFNRQEDIDFINEILNKAIDYLQNELSKEK